MTALELFSRLRRRLSLESFLMRKKLYQLSRIRKSDQKTVLFILGCQRSGTTLMLQIFEGNLEAKVYGEFSRLSSNDPKKLRLNSLASVKEVIDRQRVPLVVLKPLVETHNALKLLGFFEGAKALWMYRHYRDVAASILQLFGAETALMNLRPMVKNDPHNWRSENVSSAVRAIVLEHFSEDMNPYDAAALFWFARNNLFFELGLDQNPNVMMCRYRDFVMNPYATMNSIYRFVGHDFSGRRFMSGIHSSSVGKGKGVELSPEIDSMCQGLLGRLDEVYRGQSVGGVERGLVGKGVSLHEVYSSPGTE